MTVCIGLGRVTQNGLMDNSELDTWFTTGCTSEQTDMKSPVAIIRGLVGEVVNRHRTTNNTLHIFFS